MGKISQKRRQFNIKSKRKIRKRIKKLKERYLKTKTQKEKGEILEKIQKMAPFYPIEEITKKSQKDAKE